MSERHTPILGEAFGKYLIDAGIVPQNTRRVVIDAQLHQGLKVYIEMFGDQRFLQIGLAENLTGLEITKVADLPDGKLSEIPILLDEYEVPQSSEPKPWDF